MNFSLKLQELYLDLGLGVCAGIVVHILRYFNVCVYVCASLCVCMYIVKRFVLFPHGRKLFTFIIIINTVGIPCIRAVWTVK